MSAVIVLIFPKTGPDFLEPPFGLIALGTSLEMAGYKVKILDSRIIPYKKEIRRILKEESVLFWGVTSMTGPQLFHAISISSYIKGVSKAPVVWGGLHVTITGPLMSLKEKFVDVVVQGYADHVIIDVARKIEKGDSLENIAGVSYKDSSGRLVTNEKTDYVSLEKLPSPNWRLIQLKNYTNTLYLNKKTIYLFSSRGCTYHCSFCYQNSVGKGQWQGRRVDQIIEELKSLETLTEFDSVFFHDDNFSVDLPRLKGVVDYLKMKNKTYVISVNCSAATNDFFDAIENTGCERLDMAIESGSPEILRKYNKGFGVEDATRAILEASRRKIPVNVCFILGHPQENRKNIYETIDYMDFLKLKVPSINILDIKLLTPYPGTPIYKMCLRKGMAEPKRLKEWGEFFWNSEKMVWNGEEDFCSDLSFCSLFVFRYNHIHGKNLFFRFIFKQIHLLECWRWKNRNFSFPLELRFMRWFLRLYNKMMARYDLSWF